MNSKQIFMIITIVAALSAAMITTPVMAQNMSGENMTGGNTTGSISDISNLESNIIASNKADNEGGVLGGN
jgi:hypothetical protein